MSSEEDVLLISLGLLRQISCGELTFPGLLSTSMKP